MWTGKQSTIIYLGDSEDPHIQSVNREVSRQGIQSLTLDAWSSWSPLSIRNSNGNFSITYGGKLLEIIGVLLRLKPRLGSGFSESEAFALRERREFLIGLTSLYQERMNLINDPWKQELARNKIYQLFLAKQHGLTIPQTWITNDAVGLLNDKDTKRIKLVYKPLTWLASIDGRVLFTNKVSKKNILNNKDIIRCAPGIYQEYIRKRYEYRVTMIDENFFSVRIHSQERNDTKVDWRRNQEDVRYEKCSIPHHIMAQLTNLIDALGLRYAAIDLIESKSGEYIFLEANPAGNWLWLEERLDIPISSAIASALINEPKVRFQGRQDKQTRENKVSLSVAAKT